jgi:hypothetical protein
VDIRAGLDAVEKRDLSALPGIKNPGLRSRSPSLYRAFNDRGNPEAAWIGQNTSHRLLL